MVTKIQGATFNYIVYVKILQKVNLPCDMHGFLTELWPLENER